MSREMTQRLHTALTDQNLQTALTRLFTFSRAIREMVFASIDFEGLSRDVRLLKEKSIDDLPRLIDEFKTNASRAGAIVYEAKNDKAANDYVLKLTQKRGVKHIVKSKSMLTEEIQLREHLEKAGIEVKETDIGEWIVQLAEERPAHIVGPAIHKTIEQVAELISKATGEKLPPEPQVLLDAARHALRESYLDAEMGISGANIAIAESGTLVIVTNEGNGCMTTTLPPIHVAVVGYEKLVPSLEDANTIFRLLSRCTIGLKMPVYTSFISGHSRIEAILGALDGQGLGELHIILVDNGRSRMRESEEFREALYCIRCGVCLNVCPVFGSVAGQTYGYIYQGGIGAILTAFSHGIDRAKDLASLCLNCMACRDVCPARIDIPGMVTRLKARIVAERGLSWQSRIAYRALLKRPGRFSAAMKLGAYLQRPFADSDSMIRQLPTPLKSLTNTISLPVLSSQPLGTRLKGYSSPKVGVRPKVAFYSGCVTQYAYPEVGEDVIKVLQEHGAEPYYPLRQTCCGAPAYYVGDAATALSLAKTNITALEEDNPEYIATVCPGCAVMLQKEYLRLTDKEPEWNDRAKVLAGKIRDFSQLVLELTPKAENKPVQNRKVAYHDPCHLKRGIGIYKEPRQLLQREGFEVIELADAGVCCGFGGHVVLEYPELSASILKRKLDSIEASGVDTVVTNCTACILQLRGGLDKRKSKVRVIHSAELLGRQR